MGKRHFCYDGRSFCGTLKMLCRLWSWRTYLLFLRLLPLPILFTYKWSLRREICVLLELRIKFLFQGWSKVTTYIVISSHSKVELVPISTCFSLQFADITIICDNENLCKNANFYIYHITLWHVAKSQCFISLTVSMISFIKHFSINNFHMK